MVGDAMAYASRGGLHRLHLRLDQGKLPSLESSLDWAPMALHRRR